MKRATAGQQQAQWRTTRSRSDAKRSKTCDWFVASGTILRSMSNCMQVHHYSLYHILFLFLAGTYKKHKLENMVAVTRKRDRGTVYGAISSLSGPHISQETRNGQGESGRGGQTYNHRLEYTKRQKKASTDPKTPGS
jgi:hypothetical protein